MNSGVPNISIVLNKGDFQESLTFLIEIIEIIGFFKRNSHYSNAGQKSAEGRFLSKWVYNFLPAQKLVHLSGYSSPLKSHMGVVNFQKMCAKSSSL